MGEGLEGTGLIGGSRGKEGSREEGERGSRFQALSKTPEIAAKIAPKNQFPPAPAIGAESRAEGQLPLELPPKPSNWAKVEEDWHRLGRYWPGGEPARPRDRKLLWRLLGLAHWDSHPSQAWARVILEAFCDAAGTIRNPGAYLEKITLGNPQDGITLRLVLRQVDTPDWVRHQGKRPRSRSPPAETPLLELAEAAERKELAAQWREIMEKLKTKKT